jgi:signal transduction histidine kinase
MDYNWRKDFRLQEGAMTRDGMSRFLHEENVFLFMLGYRWLSLVPPALALVLTRSDLLVLFALAFAIFDTFILTLFHARLNRLVQNYPLSLAIDLVVAAGLIALTGGTNSPYYLFALSPILAAAFFFQLRGGLIAASAFSVLYVAALSIANAGWYMPPSVLGAVSQIAGFFLIAALFGYLSILLKRVHATTTALEHVHDELTRKNAILERSNRDWQSIHALAQAIQSSAIDVLDVEEKILVTITGDLEFERVMLGLVNQENQTLLGWLTHQRRTWYESPEGLFAANEIPLRAESGLIAQCILTGQPRNITDGAPPTNDAALNARLGLTRYAILPLIMRDHPVGVLLVDNPDSGAAISPESFRSLATVAQQAALALGSTKLCVERAQRLAVEEERNRIAMEIHDTASQALFGIVYALDACIKMLPPEANNVKARLQDTRAVAEHTMYDLRRSVYDIWSRELTANEFSAELRAHLAKLDAPKTLDVAIQVQGDLETLDPTAQKNLLRIAEEGLSNVVKHSRATRATVCLSVTPQQTRLVVEDNGRGVTPRANGYSGFGLKSVRERARVIGAEVWLNNRAEGGAKLEVVLNASAAVCDDTFPRDNRSEGTALDANSAGG